MTKFVLFVAAVVLCGGDRYYYDCSRRQTGTAAAVAAHDVSDSVKSQVGGYAVFECPVPRRVVDGVRPFVTRWTKDVSVSYTYRIIHGVRQISANV